MSERQRQRNIAVVLALFLVGCGGHVSYRAVVPAMPTKNRMPSGLIVLESRAALEKLIAQLGLPAKGTVSLTNLRFDWANSLLMAAIEPDVPISRTLRVRSVKRGPTALRIEADWAGTAEEELQGTSANRLALIEMPATAMNGMMGVEFFINERQQPVFHQK